MTGAAPGSVRVASLGQLPEWQYHLLHDRSEHCLIWITRGQGRAVVDGARRGLGPHNALFLPGGTLFSVDPGPQSLALVLTCRANAAAGLWPSRPMHLRVRDSFAQSELTGLLDMMMREQSGTRPMLDEALEAHARLVAVWLHRQAREQDEIRAENAATRLMKLFSGALSAGYRSDRGVSGYASALGVTATHLTRTSRSSCGRTAAAMLAERKLHEAHRQLREPGLPVNHIARGLGFHSAPYFTRFIRSHTGLTPTEIRNGARPPRSRRSLS